MSFAIGPKELDILKEVGNIGAGHAARALSMLVRDTVQLSVTAARLCEFDRISDVVGGPEAVVVGVFLRLTGDVAGSVLFLLSRESAANVIARLLAPSGDETDFTEMELSALAEVGNILSGSYVNAISQLSSLHIHQSVPAVAMDMAGAILDGGLSLVGETADSAILIDTEMFLGARVIDSHVFLLPDPTSAGPLLRALGAGE